MVSFEEGTKEAAPVVPQEPAFTTDSLRSRVRASLRYSRQSITGLLSMGNGSSSRNLGFSEQLEQCKAAPAGKHARKSEVGELWDMEFSEELMDDDAPKNSDEAKAAKEEAAQGTGWFGWGAAAAKPAEEEESSATAEEEPATKAKRRDSAGSIASTASAASFLGGLWSSMTGNNSKGNLETSSSGFKSSKIESALGKLDRTDDDSEEEGSDLFEAVNRK